MTTSSDVTVNLSNWDSQYRLVEKMEQETKAHTLLKS
jgi:hypothetical protein